MYLVGFTVEIILGCTALWTQKSAVLFLLRSSITMNTKQKSAVLFLLLSSITMNTKQKSAVLFLLLSNITMNTKQKSAELFLLLNRFTMNTNTYQKYITYGMYQISVCAVSGEASRCVAMKCMSVVSLTQTFIGCNKIEIYLKSHISDMFRLLYTAIYRLQFKRRFDIQLAVSSKHETSFT